MSVLHWLKNLFHSTTTLAKKSSSFMMAKEADVKSPRKWLRELYGDSLEPKKASQFIHAEKRQTGQPIAQTDRDLSEILEEALEDPNKK